jgi:hypothetical protein
MIKWVIDQPEYKKTCIHDIIFNALVSNLHLTTGILKGLKLSLEKNKYQRKLESSSLDNYFQFDKKLIQINGTECEHTVWWSISYQRRSDTLQTS